MSALQEAVDPFRRQVIAEMERRGWSYGRVATTAEVSASALTHFLAGCEPQRDTVERVADTLSLPYPEISDEVWGWHAGVNRGR